MGQYYLAAVINDEFKVFHPCDYDDNGPKLMEHSYTGNHFLQVVYNEILNKPSKVAWIGDYCIDVLGDKWEWKFRDNWDEFIETVQRAYATIPTEDGERFEFDPLDDWYLVNETKKKYVPYGEYYRWNQWQMKDYHGNYSTWCIDPLPLLTACGNGRGGGDYRGGDRDYVGSWAFDLIQMTQKEPTGYYCVLPEFQEEWGRPKKTEKNYDNELY